MLTCTLMLVVSIALTIGFILSIDAGLQLWRNTDESTLSDSSNVQRVWMYLRCGEQVKKSYNVIRRGMDEGEALELLRSHPTANRLEMWCDMLADSPKGYAPNGGNNEKHNRQYARHHRFARCNRKTFSARI